MISALGLLVAAIGVFVIWTQLIDPLINDRPCWPFFSKEAKLEEKIIALKEQKRVDELAKEVEELEASFSEPKGSTKE